jgi:hemerythrin-like metal-binding protein
MAEEFIVWTEKCRIGIEEVDQQHRKLFALTNALHSSSVDKSENQQEVFSMALRECVEYVQRHFSYEEQLLEKLGYPELASHRAMHKTFVQQILDSTKAFKNGQDERNSIVIFNFVRFLRDWIMSHIMVNDMEWANWVKTQYKKDK